MRIALLWLISVAVRVSCQDNLEDVPNGCVEWFDGCNTCFRNQDDWRSWSCTEMACAEVEPSECQEYGCFGAEPECDVECCLSGEWSCYGCPVLTELDALAWMDDYEENLRISYREHNEVWWRHSTNITDENMQAALEWDSMWGEYATAKLVEVEAFHYNDFYLTFKNPELVRKFEFLRGGSPKEKAPRDRLSEVSSEMSTIYSTSTVCEDEDTDGEDDGEPTCLRLDPELTEVMATSRDYDELLDAWSNWRDVAGRGVKELYTEYVELKNLGATDYGFADTGARWRSYYDMPADQFPGEVETLWQQILPLYEELHCYVRDKVNEMYPEQDIQNLIPAHLLGNMWAQNWMDLQNELIPFPDEQTLDATLAIVEQNITAIQMMEISEDFFKALGFRDLPQAFWDKSLFVRPEDREVVCHPSAKDFCAGESSCEDARIKMCTTQTEYDFFVVAHEMGHIYYFMEYSNLTALFRDGANDGFHEAVGDTIFLSVSTVPHLHALGLLEQEQLTVEGEINYLMKTALDKIAFIPFGYLVDQWRWEVFAGLDPSLYNQRWWELRRQYQGIDAPIPRTGDDFDPGAKYHVPNDVPYMKYFLAGVLQFQFHRDLCSLSGHEGPLYECDISTGDTETVGEALRSMLKLGASKPWQDALEQLAGERQIDGESIIEYFRPLYEWLVEDNQQNSRTCGWDPLQPFVADQDQGEQDDQDDQDQDVRDCGNCNTEHVRTGCDDSETEECVCSVSPWCCEFHWHLICADISHSVCGCEKRDEIQDCAGCKEASDSPGCDHAPTENCVCSFDSYCCDRRFDELCVDIGSHLCGCY